MGFTGCGNGLFGGFFHTLYHKSGSQWDFRGFSNSKFDEGFMGWVFGFVDISGELRVDSLGGVLQGVEMVCLVGFSTPFTTEVVHKGF